MNFNRVFNDYTKAVGNEVSVDEYFYRINGCKPRQFGFLPRPAVWIGNKRISKRIVFFVSCFLKTILFLGGWVVFFLIDFIYLYFFASKKKTVFVADEKKIYYALGFSMRAYDVIKKDMFKNINIRWVYFPWVKLGLDDDGIDCLSLLTKKEAFFLIWVSIVIIYKIILKNDKTIWVLQCYTVYRWLLVRLALSKLEADGFICSEHFDRWAVLIDTLMVSKSDEESGKLYALNIVQHGIVNGEVEKSENNDSLPFELFYKLKAVTNLFLYDIGSKDIFKKSIISNDRLLKEIEIVYFKSYIKVQNITEGSGRFKILFVGHPSCLEQHILFFDCLGDDFDCFYKPHPALRIPKNCYKVGWTMIKDVSFFPQVDILVSYPSTLVDEYKQYNIFSVVHSLNASKDEVLKCIDSINRNFKIK